MNYPGAGTLCELQGCRRGAQQDQQTVLGHANLAGEAADIADHVQGGGLGGKAGGIVQLAGCQVAFELERLRREAIVVEVNAQ